jgi:hypothetical protein
VTVSTADVLDLTECGMDTAETAEFCEIAESPDPRLTTSCDEGLLGGRLGESVSEPLLVGRGGGPERPGNGGGDRTTVLMTGGGGWTPLLLALAGSLLTWSGTDVTGGLLTVLDLASKRGRSAEVGGGLAARAPAAAPLLSLA